MSGPALALSQQPAAPAAQSQLRIPTIEQLAAHPVMSSFAVSPNGRYIAALQSEGDTRVVRVWDTQNFTAEPRTFNSTGPQLQGVGFVSDGVIAISAFEPFDSGTFHSFRGKLFFVNIDGSGGWRDPLTSIRARSQAEEQMLRLSSAQIIDDLPRDPDNVLMQVGADVYLYNVNNGRIERLLRGGEDIISYDTDHTGAIRARSLVGRDGEGLYIATEFRSGDGDWQEHIRTRPRDREVFSVAAFSSDPNVAFVISNRNRDKAAIFEYDIAARRLADEPAFAHPLFEAQGVSIWDAPGPDQGEVASFTFAGPRSTEFPILPQYEALLAGINQALNIEEQVTPVTDPATGRTARIRFAADRYAQVVSASDDLNTAVVWVGGPNDPGAYYLLQDKSRLQLLSRPHPDLDPAVLGRTTFTSYEARDGLDIPAFVTRPSEALYGPGPYPTVILPHGGPWSRDNLEWDWSLWPQMLASRGYAVIQPQFRGSDGWGKRLWMAGDNQWGQTMQDDLDDAVGWAVEQGIAQRERVAMFGFSYGGYAAMAAAVRPNGLYKCAISGAGVSDLTRIRNALFRNPYQREAQRDTVSGLSPLTQAANISIPILVYHGVRDQTVPIEQSVMFYERARAAGRDIRYEELPDFAHGQAYTREVNQRQLRLIEEYLRTGCGGSGL
ncbi:prolyl oligopeptidase family serine peptidase [Brevundimonas sp. 2R-24]|uniref:Prolyl oligopeptidase family serine peptidase n=1 Tax=Peiella sedimenti TaxID=3061083 RepID=A0ABT8SPK1_9CAUL|nr:prolyl oligopeptidase family serine peptidase [Caulobacteraceae bacterium XZ-24]